MKKIIIVLLIFVFSISFIGYNSETVEDIKTTSGIVTNYKESVLVYFPKLPDMNFCGEKLELDKNLTVESKIYKIIDKLIKGPESENLINIIPTGTVLKGANIKDGIAYLNFSKEFVENHPGGSIGEYNTIYGIVNSITELPEIEAVDFSVEGKKIATYKGHCEFSTPIYRD